jgi:tetratricopeptide (TPR) repeat protein
VAAACRGTEPPRPSPPRARPLTTAPESSSEDAAEDAAEDTSPSFSAEVRAEYEQAKDAVRAQDYRRAQAHLEKTVALLPDFTEGWYNLGATYAHLAIVAAQESGRDEALAYFRQAVDAKRTARDLMDQGRWYVYLAEEEQTQVRGDVEKALEDADAVLADEASLLIALRIWAGEAP